MLTRLLRWFRYRRILATYVREHENAGYEVSPPALAELRWLARARSQR